MELWQNDEDRIGGTEVLRVKRVSVPLCPPWAGFGLNSGLCCERLAVNDLRHGMTVKLM
jgi:hypothetical protein